MPEIIKATLDHLSDIQKLNHKLFETEYNGGFDDNIQVGWSISDTGKDYFEDMIVNNSVYVAMQEKEVIGYLAGSFPIKASYVKEDCAEINNMYVSENHRQEGIGSLLVDAFKEECFSKNIYSIQVTASAKNIKAIAFYEKSGFNPCNITLQYDRQR